MKNFTFTATDDLFQIFPRAQIAGLLISDLQIKPKTSTNIDIISANILNKFLQTGMALEHRPEITAWLKAFSSLGLNTKDHTPSHVALARRIFKNKQLMRINLLVDLYNLFSLRFLIPIGGHDIGAITKITVGKTKGGEVFKTMGSEQVIKLPANEFAYLDEQNRVLTRNLVWRQSDFSKVTEQTKELFIPIDDIPGIKTTSDLSRIAAELVGILKEFADFTYEFKVISKFNNLAHYGESDTSELKATKPAILLSKAKVNNSQAAVEEFFDRKLDEIYPSKEELKRALLSGRKLRFYFGADSTAPRLHIGHIVPMLKLAQLQKLGHQIIILIGDFTGMIGDPTDKSATRVKLTEEEVRSNANKYREQISKYINFQDSDNPVDLVFNSDWNRSLDFSDVIELSSQFTVQQMLERDMFQERLKKNKPIYLHEFLYPLMQGNDSVFLEVDGEFGGRDQTFNMLAGRQLAKSLRNIDKFVITTKFLLSGDGVTKMSKSIGNCIYISDTPEDKYGKVMAIPDNMISHYYQLATNYSDQRISELEQQLQKPEAAMNLKKQLAFEIVKLNDSEAAAQKAQKYFETTIQNNEMPEDTASVSRASLANISSNGLVEIKALLVKLQLAPSNAEAKRLIKFGAVEIDGQKVTDINASLELRVISVIRVGKLNWRKLTD